MFIVGFEQGTFESEGDGASMDLSWLGCRTSTRTLSFTHSKLTYIEILEAHRMDFEARNPSKLEKIIDGVRESQ